MPLIEIPYIGTEFLFNYNEVVNPKYQNAPFMSTTWQRSLKYFEKFNKFNDSMQPQYFVLKTLHQRVALQIAAPDLDFDGAFLYFEKCDGTRVEVAVLPSVVIVPGDVNKLGQQLRRLTWQFFVDDWVADAGHYCWYLRVNYTGGVFEELAGMPMDIQAEHPNTVLIEYTHSAMEFDFWFDEVLLTHRINATNNYLQDKLELLNFRNQKANLRLLYARNWAVWNFEIGFPGEGINNWDQKKMYQIFKCDEVYIDGVRFLMEDEAEFELTDYGNRYPLKKMAVQLVEYDQSDSSTVGSDGIVEIMRLDIDGYPYLIDALTLFAFTGGGVAFANFTLSYAASNFQIEILNTAMQNDFLDQLDVDAVLFGMTGSFYEDGGILYYQRGIGETYLPYSTSKLSTCHIVNYEAFPANLTIFLQVLQTSKTSVTVRKTDDTVYLQPDLNVGNFTTSYAIADPDYDDYVMRVYCDDTMTVLNIVAEGGMINSLGGKVSPTLNRYQCNGGDVGSIGIGFLLNAKLEIQYLFLEQLGVTAVDSTDFSPVGDFGRWQKLKYWGLRGNKLTAAAQDNFYIDYYDIASVYHTLPPPPMNLDTRFQTPPSAPTALSGAARSVLTTYGFTISF